MVPGDMKTRLTKALHDAKATIWTAAGHHLKRLKNPFHLLCSFKGEGSWTFWFIQREMEERSSFRCKLFREIHRFLSDFLRLSGGWMDFT